VDVTDTGIDFRPNEDLSGLEVELTADDMARIDAELPEVAGERYDKAGMAAVNL
jgi:hypothetical protein